MNDLSSLILYLSVFALSSLLVALYFKYREKRIIASLLLLASMLLPILLSGLRYVVGVDYWSYDEKFHFVADAGWGDLISMWGQAYWNYIEPSFFLIAKLTSLITESSWLLFTTYAAITVIGFYAGIIKTKSRYMALMVFIFLLFFFPQSFNAVRQLAAMAVIFYATICLLNGGKGRHFIVLNIAAALLHYTAIIYLPLGCIYMWLRSKGTLKHVRIKHTMASILIILGSIIIGYFATLYVPVLGKFKVALATMMESSITMTAWISTLLNNLIKFGFVALFYNKIIALRPEARFYFFLFAIGTSLFLLFPISHVFFFRVSLYFTIFFVVLLPMLLEVIKSRRLRYLMATGIIVFGVASFIRSNYYYDSIHIMPYNSVFDKAREGQL